MARLKAPMTRSQAADRLGVTQRTVRNWEEGRSRVPYSAFKLLRILSGYELPGEAWCGWSVCGDTLITPEQKAFRPDELAWWGLTVAMARDWKRLYRDRASDSVARGASVVLAPFLAKHRAVDLALSPFEQAAHAAAPGNPTALSSGERGSPVHARSMRLIRPAAGAQPVQPGGRLSKLAVPSNTANSSGFRMLSKPLPLVGQALNKKGGRNGFV